jgi:hypothetical protein
METRNGSDSSCYRGGVIVPPRKPERPCENRAFRSSEGTQCGGAPGSEGAESPQSLPATRQRLGHRNAFEKRPFVPQRVNAQTCSLPAGFEAGVLQVY